jgi:hypothetical protein
VRTPASRNASATARPRAGQPAIRRRCDQRGCLAAARADRSGPARLVRVDGDLAVATPTTVRFLLHVAGWIRAPADAPCYTAAWPWTTALAAAFRRLRALFTPAQLRQPGATPPPLARVSTHAVKPSITPWQDVSAANSPPPPWTRLSAARAAPPSGPRRLVARWSFSVATG